MTSQPQGAGIVLDVEALRRAADALRAAAPALAEVTGAASRVVAESGAAAGAPTLASALDELARRWIEGVTSVPGRVDGYGVLLRATVDAHVADDAAFSAPPR